MNCKSCVHEEFDCMYQKLKKAMELDIYTMEFDDVLSIKCSKYSKRISNTGNDEFIEIRLVGKICR